MYKRQASCTVVFDTTKNRKQLKLHSISVVTSKEHHWIELYANETDDCLYFDSIQEAYDYILNTLYHNDFRLNYYYMMNATWYDILWVNVSTKQTQKFGYIGNRKEK